MSKKEIVAKNIKEYYKTYKRFPRQGWISTESGVPLKDLKLILEELLVDGFLERYGTTYILNRNFVYNKKEIKETKTVNNINEIIIKVVMGIVSLSAVVISIYYSRFWLLEFLEPVKATLLSCTMIFYAVIAPEGALFLIQNKHYMLGGVVIFTAVIVLIFSILSTVAGQYNVRSMEIQNTTSVKKNLYQLELLKKQETELVNSVNRLQKDFDLTQKLLSEYKKEDINSKEYTTQFWKNYRIKKDIEKVQDKLDAKREEIINYLDTEETVVEEREDFYTWISELLKVDSKIVEFWLSLFPAVFVDVIAPIGFLIAFDMFKKESING